MMYSDAECTSETFELLERYGARRPGPHLRLQRHDKSCVRYSLRRQPLRGCRELPPGGSTGDASHAQALAYISMGRCAPQAVPGTLLACIESCKICSSR